jgi:excinuclease UvrABC nuclease subunit
MVKKTHEYVASLYRYYNKDGVLLYVGVAFNAHGRLANHITTKEWAYDIKYIKLDHYERKFDALAAEREAIAIEKPRHNVVGNKNVIFKSRY